MSDELPHHQQLGLGAEGSREAHGVVAREQGEAGREACRLPAREDARRLIGDGDDPSCGAGGASLIFSTPKRSLAAVSGGGVAGRFAAEIDNR